MVRYSSSKEMNKVLHELKQHGWVIEPTKKHLKLHSPEGFMVTASSTPGCPYAHKQVLKDIRRKQNQTYSTPALLDKSA